MNYRDVNPLYSPIIYSVTKNLQAFLFNTVWRRKVRGLENVPPFGTSTIFAANHRSLSDPSNVGSCLSYPIFFFAKEELFRVPVLGWIITRVNAFPVRRREHDIGAFKTAIEVLEHGGGLMLFPEGGRRLDPVRQWKAKAGVGMLACKTGARVVPVGIKASAGWPSLVRLEVNFGKPIFPPADPQPSDYQKITDEVMSRIKELCNE